MPPLIRSALPDEAGALHSLAAATFPLACPPGTTAADIADFVASHLGVDAFVRYLTDPARTVLVAEEGEELLGYTMLVAGEPLDADVALAVATRPTAELSKCYVVPEAHGRGVATALVEATVEDAARRAAESVWLGVNQHNARANRFYARCGFREIGTKRFRVGAHLHDDFIRERRIP